MNWFTYKLGQSDNDIDFNAILGSIVTEGDRRRYYELMNNGEDVGGVVGEITSRLIDTIASQYGLDVRTLNAHRHLYEGIVDQWMDNGIISGDGAADDDSLLNRPPDIYRDEETGRMMVNWGGMSGREPLEEDYPGEHDGNRGSRGP